MEAALKVAELLCSTMSEKAFSEVLSRAASLSLNVSTEREVPIPEEEIDLSDVEDIPLSANDDEILDP